MQAERAFVPDWRDFAAYAPLLAADRSLVAWEWLRRDPRYRAAANAAGSQARVSRASRAGEFGLVEFEAPDRAVPRARPLWRGDAHPYVLSARPFDRASKADLFDLGRFSRLARIIEGRRADHLLLSDGFRTIRIDTLHGSLADGPVCLRYELAGIDTAEPPLLTLRRFLALSRNGRFARSLHPREMRARRWILMLRAWDALSVGAGQREIAAELLSRSVAEERWRSRESSVRAQVQRLVKGARQMAAGGYRNLLRSA